MKNCLIYANAGAFSCGVVLNNCPASIDSSTVVYNDCPVPQSEGGAALWADGDPPEDAPEVHISNSIFWGNNDIGETVGSPPFHKRRPGVFLRKGEIRYSIVQQSTPPFDTGYQINDPWGWVRYVNVMEADPMFVHWQAGDFRLLPGSPAIDAGDPASPLDPDGTRKDIGAVFPDLPPRYVFIRGDANGDGELDISDAVRILVGLFVDPSFVSCLDAADANDDGAVGITDAIVVLNFLFGDRGELPGPAEPHIWGVDFTEDGLDCRW